MLKKLITLTVIEINYFSTHSIIIYIIFRNAIFRIVIFRIVIFRDAIASCENNCKTGSVSHTGPLGSYPKPYCKHYYFFLEKIIE